MLVASYSEVDVLYQVVDKPYARVKTSLEVYKKDRLSYNEEQHGKPIKPTAPDAPDAWRHNPTNPSNKPDFVFMTEDIQHWIFRMNLENLMGRMFAFEEEYRDYWKGQLSLYKANRESGSQLISWWNSLFKGDRYATNSAGVEARKNYIAQENLNEDFPKFSNVVSGDFVGVLNDPERVSFVAGVKCRPFKCINISKGDYRNYHPFTTPEYFDQPAVSGRSLYYDKAGWHVSEYWMRVFWNFDMRVILPFMLPLDSVTWIDANIIELGGAPMSKPLGVYGRMAA